MLMIELNKNRREVS